MGNRKEATRKPHLNLQITTMLILVLNCGVFLPVVIILCTWCLLFLPMEVILESVLFLPVVVTLFFIVLPVVVILFRLLLYLLWLYCFVYCFTCGGYTVLFCLLLYL